MQRTWNVTGKLILVGSYSYIFDIGLSWSTRSGRQAIGLEYNGTFETPRDKLRPRNYRYAPAWVAPNENSFYTWGGFTSAGYEPNTTDNDVWIYNKTSFDIAKENTDGGGRWGIVERPTDATFKPNTRTAGASSATGNGRLYLLGSITTATGTNYPPYTAKPGLWTFDMETETWATETNPMSPTDTVAFGQLQFVPSFGSQGVLIALGGEGAGADLLWPGNGSQAIEFSKVDIYDVAAKTWYRQSAIEGEAGAIPSLCSMFCSVGVGSDETHQIYVYGGQLGNHPHTARNPGHEASNNLNWKKTGVHILSLPGFVWFKAGDTSAAPRSGHTCQLAGKHMISIGGVDPTKDQVSQFLNSWDDNVIGVSVFDTVDLLWRSYHNAGAPNYSTSSII